MPGTELRLRRIFPPGRPGLFAVPLDHSVSMGPIDGLEAAAPLVQELQAAGADMFIVTKGTARQVAPVLASRTLLGIHVSASTALAPNPDHKRLVGTAQEAVALGADLLSVQVNFGVPEEGEMLADLGVAADQCRALGLPLLCMTYVKGAAASGPDALRHAARAVADLGADIVKTGYPGSLEAFTQMVRSTPVPILIGGGSRMDDPRQLLAVVRQAMAAGGRGICIGRNLFQRRPVASLAGEVARLLHGG